MSDSHSSPSSSTTEATPLLPPAEYARSRHGSEHATGGTLREETVFTVLLARRPGGGA